MEKQKAVVEAKKTIGRYSAMMGQSQLMQTRAATDAKYLCEDSEYQSMLENIEKIAHQVLLKENLGRALITDFQKLRTGENALSDAEFNRVIDELVAMNTMLDALAADIKCVLKTIDAKEDLCPHCSVYIATCFCSGGAQ